MKAVIQRGYGFPDDVLELVEVDEPAVGRGEVLVRVRASSVAGDDWHLLQGWPYVARFATGLRGPRNVVPGRDLAGRVAAVGSGVTRLEPGDEVFGWCSGGFAEYACVPEAALERRPANISLEEAAVVPVCAFTALQGLRDKGGIRSGTSVLIVGASGGVGTFAVQIAKSFDAEVTGVCSAANASLVYSLGADRVIDYMSEDFAADGRRYDLILDMVGSRSLGALRRALTSAGTLVMVGGSGGRWLKGTHRFLAGPVLAVFSRQRLRPLVHTARRDDLMTVKHLIEAGAVTPVIGARYTLDRIGEAIAHFAHGHARGKVLIAI